MTTGLLTTTAGRNAIIADLGGGADLVLTHVAWGDANGVPYNPNEAQVALVNEKFRTTIASVAVVGGAIVVDAVIPADTDDSSGRPSHGFNVAEVGLFSNTGTLIGVARCGNGYKPPPSSGQVSDVTYRLKLAVANPSAITVVIDPLAQVNVGRDVRPFWLTVDGVVNDPPGAPAVGATYVVGAAPTGAWAGFAHRLAQWVGVWAVAIVPDGHVVCDNSKTEDSSSRFMRKAAAGWVSGAASTSAYGLALLATPAEAVAAASTTKVPSVDAMAESQQSNRLNWAVAGGTANAWTIDLLRALSAYTKGRVLWVKAPAANTSTTVTANASGVGNRRIKKANGADPAVGDIIGGTWYPMIDDDANFCILSPLPSDITGLSGGRYFTANDTLTIPDGITRIRIRAWGGGAGGGGINPSGGAAGGGGGGEYREGWFNVAPGTTHAVTVGIGGNGGTNAGTNGANGGSTSVGSLLTAVGGLFGAGVSGTYGQGGLGGSGGSGGQFNQNGGNGSNGGNLGSVTSSGTGGGSWMVTNHYIQFNAGAGGAALFYGQGGNGATGGGGAAAGGNGKSGLVIVEW